MNSQEISNKTKQCDNKLEIKPVYNKPILQRYGSISEITAGRNGSIVDTSGPGTRTKDTPPTTP